MTLVYFGAAVLLLAATALVAAMQDAPLWTYLLILHLFAFEKWVERHLPRP